jgi:glycosyltransferase involved in cell wall biosynthesis
VLSITVPVYNEEESIGPLADAVRSALTSWCQDWELVFVDDRSEDRTIEAIEAQMTSEPRIRLVRLARNYGQSAAMQAGFDHAKGDIIVTMDGDLQNDPMDIRALVDELEQGHDLVVGYRERRQDPVLSRRIPSWFGNALLRSVSGVPIRDSGCTLKVFRRELLDRLTLYSDLHRFIPALAVAVAGARVAQIPVRHHPRKFGRTKYGISRVGKVLADLLTLVMLRLFAIAGTGALMLAFVATALAMLDAWDRVEGSVVVLSAVAVCWLALGGFLVMAGLIAESFLQAEGDSPPFEGVLIRRVAS